MFDMNSHEKAEHDMVVATRVGQLGLIYEANANINGRNMTGVDELYPDIIVIDKNREIIFIEEIETESTITENQRDVKWKRYSNLECSFNLIVPESQVLRAQHLINGLFLNRLYYYKITPIGIRFRQVNGLTI
jgi:hypothetical protein